MPDELLSRQAFVEARLAARELLLDRAIDVLEGAGAVEGHLLGSLGRGEADELSDIDLWVTFEDEDTPHAIRERSGLYRQIAPVLLTHEAEANAPVGGKFSLVIFATETGPLMVDFQFSPLSTAVVDSGAKRLFGAVALPEGDRQSTSRSGEVTRSERIDFLIAMASTALKYVARGRPQLAAFALKAYAHLREQHLAQLPPLEPTPSYRTLRATLEAVKTHADQSQNRAIDALLAYQRDLERLYPAA